jgi:PKD repeat protein
MSFSAKALIAGVFAILLLGAPVTSAPEQVRGPAAVCGDANNDGVSTDWTDVNYLKNYLLKATTSLPNPDNVDLDDRQLVTARDLLFLMDHWYNSTPLTCPATQPPLIPVLDPNSMLSVVPPVVVKANATTAKVTLELCNSFTMGGLVIPLQVRVGGQPPDAISNLQMGGYFGIGGCITDRGNGRILMLEDSLFLWPLAKGCRILATFDVTMNSSQSSDRTVSVEFINLPPTQSSVDVNSPMLFESAYPFTAHLPDIQQHQELSLYANPTMVNVNDPVFFTGTCTVPVDNNTWQWDFGDGQTGTGQFPVHSYSGTPQGPFTVTVSVNPLSGGTWSTTRLAYINGIPLVVDFNSAPRAGSVPMPMTVQFTDLTVGSPTNPPTSATSWSWDFGDGYGSTVKNPSHTYSVPGLYDVCLTASNVLFADKHCYLGHIRVDAVATPDLQALIFSPATMRKGRTETVTVTARNIGTGDASGNTLTLDLSGLAAAQVSFVLPIAKPPDQTLPGPIYKWYLPTMTWDPSQMTFSDFDVTIKMSVSVNANLGQKFAIMASIDAAAGETNLANNTFTANALEIGPYDPNDKQVLPVGCGGQNIVKETTDLTYFIHFENLPGAASAIDIIVVDTLSQYLDWRTLAPGPTSHAARFSFDENSGEMIWVFEGINLPPNSPPPQGEGFASFSIRPRMGMSLPVQIDNRAHVRFDFEDWMASPLSGPRTVRVGADLDINGVPDECEACLATGDVNGDGISLTIGDLSYLISYLTLGGPPPVQLSQADLNGDCLVDTNDVRIYVCYFQQGLSCFPSYPVPTCCNPRLGCCFDITGNVDCDPMDYVDISDLSVLIDNLYINFTPLCCKPEANIDGSSDGNIDISDLSALIDYLYLTFKRPAPCQ